MHSRGQCIPLVLKISITCRFFPAPGKLKTESTAAPESLINMLLLGRVDGINMAQQVVQYHLIKMNRPNAIVFDPQLLPIQDSHYYFSTLKHPKIINRLNIFLKKDSVFIEQLKKKYGL